MIWSSQTSFHLKTSQQFHHNVGTSYSLLMSLTVIQETHGSSAVTLPACPSVWSGMIVTQACCMLRRQCATACPASWTAVWTSFDWETLRKCINCQRDLLLVLKLENLPASKKYHLTSPMVQAISNPPLATRSVNHFVAADKGIQDGEYCRNDQCSDFPFHIICFQKRPT